MPQDNPPPPQGITTASRSGKSSNNSNPIVPLPAITSGSSKAWIKVASTPGNDRVSKVRHQSANGTLITHPPMRSTAATLVAGAVSGATMVARMPIRLAQNATPCAILPADAVSTPRSNCSRGVRAITLAAPRILNDPMGCKFSSFRYSSTGASVLHRTSGVRRATGEMLRRASSTCQRVIGIFLSYSSATLFQPTCYATALQQFHLITIFHAATGVSSQAYRLHSMDHPAFGL